MEALSPVRLEKIDNKLFSSPPRLTVYYKSILDGKKNTLLYFHVGNIYTLPDVCRNYIADGGSESEGARSCSMPGAEVRLTGRRGKDLKFQVSKSIENVRIRFVFIKGLFDYRIFGFSFAAI